MIKYIRSDAAIAASLEPSLIPSFFYSRQFQDDWHFGASLNVPSGDRRVEGPLFAFNRF